MSGCSCLPGREERGGLGMGAACSPPLPSTCISGVLTLWEIQAEGCTAPVYKLRNEWMNEWVNGQCRTQLSLPVKCGWLCHDWTVLPIYQVLTCVNRLDELSKGPNWHAHLTGNKTEVQRWKHKPKSYSDDSLRTLQVFSVSQFKRYIEEKLPGATSVVRASESCVSYTDVIFMGAVSLINQLPLLRLSFLLKWGLMASTSMGFCGRLIE